MLLLFTDFGLAGPYLGQLKAVLLREAPGVPVLDLFADAPSRDPRAAAYLLAAYAAAFPAGSVFVCVVDPGVGGDRAPLAVEADGRWYVGPDNGLLEIVGRRAGRLRRFEIDWRPPRLSASFHGRDLFAPVAGMLATRRRPAMTARSATEARPGAGWPDDLAEVVYADIYGNLMTGLRADRLADDAVLAVGGRRLRRARTFAAVPPGEAFWYENANGLAEIAVNLGRADALPGFAPGKPVTIE